MKIKPIAGEKYKLYNSETAKNQNSFRGFYLKKVPVTTSWMKASQKLEGHIFVNRNKNGEINYFCTRTSDKKIKMEYYTDGEDGPEWEAGFYVEDRNIKLSKLEEQFLREKIDVWEKRRKAA